MKKNQDKGFTLVELLIVIVILGILATVTVFAVRGITDKGQDNACAVEKRTVETAIEAYYANEQTDPPAIGDLVPAYLKDDPTDAANAVAPLTYGPAATLSIDFTVSPVAVAFVGKCV